MKITKEQAIQMAEKCGFEHVDHIKYRGRFSKCTVFEKDEINRFHALVQAAYEAGRESVMRDAPGGEVAMKGGAA
jgi:ferritin-like metal-binding protein YciE